MAKTPAERLMEQETRVSYGPVSHSLRGNDLAETSWELRGEEFLLRGEGHHYFHYRKGHGLTIERGPGADLTEESLWLNGSVYAAIASLNGMLPLHASAVAHGDQVFAFAGPAGTGKSTLIAALGNHGLPMFCDDTLVLDLSDPERIVCLPGHKRLKLAPDALDLTGAHAEEKVSRSVDKVFARSKSAETSHALPLGELIFLEQGSPPSIAPLTGAERFMKIRDDHHTGVLFDAATRFDRAGQFAHRARLASQIKMSRFVRPFDTSRFDEGVALAAQYVIARGS